jgi:amidohydrolase
LRADIDGLPMQEDSDVPYRSANEGRAHACGHDGHTAILLGVAALLARHRDRAPGNIRLLFQPAEEGVRGGGAKVMVADGVLEGVDEVYALHTWPPYPLGEVRVAAGPMLAQTHSMAIDVVGVGGHGAQPHDCRDPIVAASHMVCALQTVVSRGLGHEGGAVITVGSFQAGTAQNIIPERARLRGTLRTFTPEVTKRVLERIREIGDGVARSFGVTVDVALEPGYPVLENNESCASAVGRVAERVVGKRKISSAGLPIAGGEDFAYFAQKRPCAFFFLGAKRNEDTPGCHHPAFDFDDDLLPIGIAMFVGLARDRLTSLAP